MLLWGVDRVDADVVHADGETGGDDSDGEGGADIAILDTGIDSDHPDLGANLGTGTAFVECTGGSCTTTWDDDDGHGTHCAGIADARDNTEGVVGVSTNATLHAVKVLDNRGSGTFSDVAAGIEWVADQGYDVGSMSLGASSGSQTVKDACQYAADSGVLLVASAGNSGPCSDCVGYPAAYSTVIAVSATNQDDALADYSSTGSEVELAAPGSNIYSTYVDGAYETLSGTSMSCPHVSGAAGQLMDNGYSSTEARDQLTSTAEDIGLGDSESGAGLLDVEAALGGSGGGGDAAPSVSWVTPSDGETVSGTVTVQIDASDSEDGDDSLDVTYTVDDGSERATTYNSTSGYYEDSWDTTGVSDADHTLDATVTDSAGNTSTASITVATDNTEDTNSAPSASVDSLNDRSNPRWDRFEVDWSASDPDANLDAVVVELLDSGGSVLDSVTSDVGGSSASGVDEVRSKRTATQVAVTATDTDGRSGSDSRSV
jgi:subtilisin